MPHRTCQDLAMRCVAGAGLLALVGCNQIFGIGATQGIDAPLEMPTVKLDWQVATSPVASPAVPVVQFVPISPRPAVRISTLARPFAATAAEDPDQTTYGADGSIAYPLDYLHPDPPDALWRLEYTLGGGIPHEVQWHPDDTQGHLTVPVFGRIDRDPIPTGSGYAVTPTPNPPGGFVAPQVFTTGIWTAGNAPPSAATIDYDFEDAVSQSGLRGRPDPTRGDRAVLVDFAPVLECRAATGSTELTAVTLQPGVHAAQMPTWDTQLKPVMAPPVGFDFVNRLSTGLGNLQTKIDPASPLMFGALVSTDMPGLAASPEAAALMNAPLPVPVMQTLLQCPFSTLTLPGVAQPAAFDDSLRVLHVQLVATRVSLDVTLASGMETVIASPATTPLQVVFPAPIPQQIMLTTPDGVVDLTGTVDRLPVGPPGGPFTLAFTPESGADLRADYFDIVLHRFGPTGLTTERIYTVTQPRVQIDGTVLAPDADYVFEIRSYKGHPRVPHGDFSAVEFPYGATIVFTRTIKTS
jgi:hypothetical protein